MFIRKKKIKGLILRREQKARERENKFLNKKFQKIIKDIEAEHSLEIHKRERIISKKEKQHKRDLRAREIMNDNRAFFREFKDVAAPHITKMIKEFAQIMHEINRGETKDANADRKDAKVVRLHKGISETG